VRGKAVTLYRIAGALIQPGGLEDARGQEIIDAPAEAFAIARTLRAPDFIAVIGADFARALGRVGRRDEAARVLDEAEAELTALGDAAGIERMKQVRGALT
jgi:hypothetical protein